MSQIFLSYSSNDRDRVMPLVEALKSDGYSVWWDREIKPGPSFDREIERAIAEAGCIVVVWSENSIDSEWVRAEVEEGARRGLLVPVMIDDVLPPLAHRRRQAANLTDWDGERDGEYAKLVAGVEATLAGEQPSVEVAGPDASHVTVTPRRKRLRLSRSTLGAVVLVSLGVGAGLTFIVTRGRTAPLQPPAEAKFEIRLPPGLGLTANVLYPLMITPDGRTIVFNATDATGTRYYARGIGNLTAHPIEGVQSHQVQGLGSLWRGPESEWFIYNDPVVKTYKKEAISGGTPIPIADTDLPGGGVAGMDWGPDGDIVFANTANPAIMIVKGGAGKAVALTHPPDGFVDTDPRFTPDGRALVYDETKLGNKSTDNITRAMALDLKSGKSHALLDGAEPRVTTSGHLLFRRKHNLWATAFDEKHLAVYGKQVPVLEGLESGVAGWDVANNGTLVYIPTNAGSDAETHMTWLSADGKTEPVPTFQHMIVAPALSPDDTRVAVTSFPDPSANQTSIWVYSFRRQIASRLTFNKDIAALPAWSPDGKWITYVEGTFSGTSAYDVMLRASDGTGVARRLTKGAHALSPSFTPDGRFIVFSSCDKQCDIARVGVDGKTPVEVVLKSPFNEKAPVVSPDGQWLAYASNAGGQDEIFVRPWPDVDAGRWQVSSAGGDTPLWSADGTSLYYVEPVSNVLMRVAIDGGKEFSAGRPGRVVDFSGYNWQNVVGGPNFSVTRDDKRFLMLKSTPYNRIVVVLHWLDEVNRLVPTAR